LTEILEEGPEAFAEVGRHLLACSEEGVTRGRRH
jgi:hypothetical protein